MLWALAVSRDGQSRDLLWSALIAVLLAVAMATLLTLQFEQGRTLRRETAIRADSLAVMAFRFEREFLRLRHEIRIADNSKLKPDIAALQLRLDLLMSHRRLLDEHPSSSVLTSDTRVVLVFQQIDSLMAQADTAFVSKPLDLAVLTTLSRNFETIGPDIQSLSQVAARTTAKWVETQQQVLLQQNQRINLLTLVLMLMVLLAAAALVVRHRQQAAEHREKERIASQLRDANRQAEEANRGMSRFLANMSHELRTPLNGMMGMLGLLQISALDLQQAQYVRVARSSATHLLLLINDLLDISAIDEGKGKIEPVQTNLPELIRNVADMVRPSAVQKGLDLTLDIEGALTTWVITDGTRLTQILLNLLTNAIKFSKRGRVTLRLHQTAGAFVGDVYTVNLRAQVTDEGIGMDAETISRIFRRFEMGDASVSRLYGGTGLGLEISRTFARMMAGDITATSAIGVGSTFTLDIHMAVAHGPALDTIADAPLLRDPSLPGLDILVAEDHPVNRLYMAALLGLLGHGVRFAEDGEMAVAEARRQAPDLILMDLHMPKLDGWQATHQLRAGDDAACRVPIVALTADVLTNCQARAAAAGMEGFLSKPVTLAQIEQLLLRLFGARGAAPDRVQASRLPAPHLGDTAGAAVPALTATDATQAVAIQSATRRRRRFIAGDVERHLNLVHIGELWAAITLSGYRSLLESLFLDDSRSLQLLCDHLGHQRGDTLEAAAHSVKGTAASLGLIAIVGACLEVEKSCRSFDASTCTAALQRVCDSVRITHALLQTMGLVQAPCPDLGKSHAVLTTTEN